MCQIHRAGIRHHGFAKYNVLDNSGVPIVIGVCIPEVESVIFLMGWGIERGMRHEGKDTIG